MNVPEPQARQIHFDKRTSWLRDQSHLEFDLFIIKYGILPVSYIE